MVKKLDHFNGFWKTLWQEQWFKTQLGKSMVCIIQAAKAVTIQNYSTRVGMWVTPSAVIAMKAAQLVSSKHGATMPAS